MNCLKKIKNKELVNEMLYGIAGDLVYTFGFNLLIVPMALYSGGFMGMSQLLTLFVKEGLGIYVPASLNLTGIVYYLVNVPLFILGYKILGKAFTVKSIIMTTVLTVFLMIVPIPEVPIVGDYLTASILGGIICGVGAGLILRGRACGGGQDVIGMCLTKLYPGFSVGKVTIAINTVVYLICFVLFDVEIVIYSLIFATVLGLAVDKVHVQNINMSVMIFTKKTGIAHEVMTEMKRGVTTWDGEGAYTKEGTNVLLVIISKYEVSHIKQIVHKIDPNAFMIFTEGCSIDGNFEKRL